MAERKGVLQILDDFSFSLQRSGAVGILLDRLSVDCFTLCLAKRSYICKMNDLAQLLNSDISD
jgi:hypothetical protein